MTLEEIRELIKLASETGVAELEVQRGDNRVRIRLSFGADATVLLPSVPVPAAIATPPAAPAISGTKAETAATPKAVDSPGLRQIPHRRHFL